MCWDLCSTGEGALGGALLPGQSTGAHWGLPRGGAPCLVQAKENQNSEAELFHTQRCHFPLMLLFAQSKEQAA